ncbi:hypothetical protein KKD70_01620 [Patescibacteria group bacterium]|nr:hypothetical protein [Patescibacteria group bacterium]
MLSTSQDVLFIAIAVAVLLLTILLAIAILYLIFILRDASKASFYVRDTAQKINDVVYKPIMIIHSVIDKIQPIMEALHKRGEEALEKKAKEAEVKKANKSKK